MLRIIECSSFDQDSWTRSLWLDVEFQGVCTFYFLQMWCWIRMVISTSLTISIIVWFGWWVMNICVLPVAQARLDRQRMNCIWHMQFDSIVKVICMSLTNSIVAFRDSTWSIMVVVSCSENDRSKFHLVKKPHLPIVSCRWCHQWWYFTN